MNLTTVDGCAAGREDVFTALEVVEVVHAHLAEHRHQVARPDSMEIMPVHAVPVRVRLRCGGLSRVCAGLMSWYETFSNPELWVRRSTDGATLTFEVEADKDGVRYLVSDTVGWQPGYFPSLVAGCGMRLGPVVAAALARRARTPAETVEPVEALPAIPGGEG